MELKGFNFFTGVGCSLLASWIDRLSQGPHGFIHAVREDVAVGLASGAYLAGRWPCVLMQNSGIGYCLNVLTSLNLIYRIPALLVVGYRGFQGKDAPEHLVMGKHGEALLRQIGIPVWAPSGLKELSTAVAEADRKMRQDRIPAAVFIRPGILDGVR